jgi:hypothetical protein
MVYSYPILESRIYLIWAFGNRRYKVKINMDSIISLINILQQNTFNDRDFNNFIKLKGTKGFLEQEKNTNNKLNIKIIKKELKKVILDENYKDNYKFYLIKNNMEKIIKDINSIKENEDLIINQALKRVYKIVPKGVTIKSKIFLYWGGSDGGFTIDRKKVFINYQKYIGNREEFIKILSHELYHSRNFSMKDRFIFFLKIILNTNRFVYEIIGKSIEEGIACLIQHGPILKIDDPVGTLTKRNLVLSKEEFDRLNDILMDIKLDKINSKDIRKVNIYVIGYHIVSTIYNTEGVLILDDWTLNLEYRRIIDKYIEICNINNIPTGFSKEVQP